MSVSELPSICFTFNLRQLSKADSIFILAASAVPGPCPPIPALFFPASATYG